MNDDGQFDLIVVGLGAMGSAVAYHAQRLGLSVLGLDRYEPPHELGSTHAETRISRLAVGEGPQYLPFVARSHELWRELETLTGKRLLYECGGYIFTEPAQDGERWSDFAKATARVAADAGIDFELRSPQRVRSDHPLIKVPDRLTVGYEPTGALIMAEQAVTAQLNLARAGGAVIKVNEPVTTIDASDHEVVISTDLGAYHASHVALCTGPWLSELAHQRHAALTEVTRQVVYWFEVDDLAAFSHDRFPFIIWVGESDEDYVGIFPTPPGTTPGLKVVSEQFIKPTTAATVDRTVSQAEIDAFYQTKLQPKLDGVRPRCIRAAVCLYTNTPDDHFLIDSDPRSGRITVMSPCSGHGFKHSAALGEAVAERIATGTSSLDLAPFATSRFG